MQVLRERSQNHNSLIKSWPSYPVEQMYTNLSEGCKSFMCTFRERGGRCIIILFCRFLLEPIEDIRKHLQVKETEAQGKIKSIEEKVTYWKKSVQESEENIRDMLSRRAK